MKKTNLIGAICLGAALLVSTTFLTNCKKKEKDPEPTPTPAPAPPPPTNTQKLTGKNFKMTAATVDPAYNNGTTLITNWYTQVPACTKDDIYHFKDNGTYTMDEGASLCSSGDPQTVSGTWVWSTDEKKITMTMGSSSQSYNMLINDGTTVKYDWSFTENGTTYVVTETYTKQ